MDDDAAFPAMRPGDERPAGWAGLSQTERTTALRRNAFKSRRNASSALRSSACGDGFSTHDTGVHGAQVAGTLRRWSEA
jgi:hypothetical protein